jgi:hypothetical protein
MSPTDERTGPRFGLARLHVRGYRAARDVGINLSGTCALVGEANAGKSTLLAAVRMVLDADAPSPCRGDVADRSGGEIVVEGVLADGTALRYEARPPNVVRMGSADEFAVLYMPADLRSGPLVDGRHGGARASRLLTEVLARPRGRHQTGASAAALTLVGVVERLCERGCADLVVLIEEPELYLRPQAQRYLYRRLRALVELGNQVVYTTDAPAFLNVGRLDELVFVRQDHRLGVRTRQPRLDPAEHDFRFLTEFDAERSELFLARAVLLVEGATEKLVFPFIFRALGHDPDREAISIVECGGKSNILLFARVCAAAGIPHVAVHDRDSAPGRPPIASEREANRAIADIVGKRHTVELAPDFEQVAGLRSHRHKPEHAWQRFGSAGAQIPEPLSHAVRLVVSLARD